MATGPEYMNATPHHPKVKVSLSLSSPLFVAGQDITGKMEVECRAEKEVGMNLIMAELLAIQELNSRDHSATSTFLRSRCLFQGHGLPPSNAVHEYPSPGDPQLPPGYHPARRGITTFFFRFGTPLSSPSSISFANGIAKIRYDIRASIGVVYRGEKRLVTSTLEADLVQCQDMDGTTEEHVVVGEGGKIYVRGRILGGRLVTGEQSCLELQVKNHTAKKTTGLTLTLNRSLHLHGAASKVPVQLSDTLFSESFRGAEYLVHPGAEGIAKLVFNVPKVARVVKGGLREDLDNNEGGRKHTEPLFEIRCILGVKIGMGIGTKDINFEMPVQLSHRSALREPPLDAYPMPQPEPIYNYHDPRAMSPAFELPIPYYARSPAPGSGNQSPLYPPYATPPIPPSSASPPTHPYSPDPIAHLYGHPASPPPRMWSPPMPVMSPAPYYLSPIDSSQTYYYPPPPMPLAPFVYPARPNSAGPQAFARAVTPPSGLPSLASSNLIFPPFQSTHTHAQRRNLPSVPRPSQPTDGEEGKGERASRISLRLHTTTRARSMSPTSHRFPVPPPSDHQQDTTALVVNTMHAVSPRRQEGPPVLSPRPINSPRNSFSGDLSMSPNGNGTTRSERVDLLERLVDPNPGEEGKSVEEVLKDLEKAEKEALEAHKTLPAPPVPSGKLLNKRISALPRAKDVFGGLASVTENLIANDKKEKESDSPKSVLRPSPMARRLTAEEMASRESQSTAGGLQIPWQASSGLDALEKRLLKEVGTRKPEQLKKPTVFSLGFAQTSSMPPTPVLPPEPVSRPSVEGGDSEISTFALASTGSTEHQVCITGSGLNANGTEKSPRRSGPITQEKEGPGHTGRRDRGPEEKTKENEVMKLRKEAKGRVAHWLDGLAIETPKPEPARKASLGDIVTLNGPSSVRKEDKRLEGQLITSSPPSQPSSAAFANLPPRVERTKTNPVGISPSFNNEAGLSRSPALRSPIHPNKKMSLGETVTLSPIVAEKADGSKSPKSPRSLPFAIPARPEKPEYLQGKAFGKPTLEQPISTPPMSPPPISPKPAALVSPRKGGLPTTNEPSLQIQAISHEPPVKPVQHLFPPSSKPIPDSKYDVRSARGGKGGIATSVAAIWTSLAEKNSEDHANMRPPATPAVHNATKRPAILDVGKANATPAKESDQSFNKPSDVNSSDSSSSTPAVSSEPRNRIKAASVPAAIVPSLAKPHISSTASLARPVLSPSPRSKPPSLSPLLDVDEETPSTRPQASTNLAFGQARLKELIKKYQETT